MESYASSVFIKVSMEVTVPWFECELSENATQAELGIRELLSTLQAGGPNERPEDRGGSTVHFKALL